MQRKLLWSIAILVSTLLVGFVIGLTLDLNLDGHKAKPLENQQISILIHDPNINQFVLYPFAQYTNGGYKELTDGQIMRDFFIYESQEVMGQFKVTNISRSKTFGCSEPVVGMGKGTF